MKSEQWGTVQIKSLQETIGILIYGKDKRAPIPSTLNFGNWTADRTEILIKILCDSWSSDIEISIMHLEQCLHFYKDNAFVTQTIGGFLAWNVLTKTPQ